MWRDTETKEDKAIREAKVGKLSKEDSAEAEIQQDVGDLETKEETTLEDEKDYKTYQEIPEKEKKDYGIQ